MANELLEYHSGVDSVYYTGPLTEAMIVEDSTLRLTVRADGQIYIDSDAAYGVGPTFEVALRYYFGSVFGPIDENYDKKVLREVLGEAHKIVEENEQNYHAKKK